MLGGAFFSFLGAASEGAGAGAGTFSSPIFASLLKN